MIQKSYSPYGMMSSGEDRRCQDAIVMKYKKHKKESVQLVHMKQAIDKGIYSH